MQVVENPLEIHHPKYRIFLEQLLCRPGETLELYSDLFDLRPAIVKRREFAGQRVARMGDLIERFGRVCMLRFAPDCNPAIAEHVDHLIPLSSNKLNKLLLGATTSRDANGNMRKAPTESFGSNGDRNVVLACRNCNSFKQNKFLEAPDIRRVLRLFEENTAS
jgi:hypothetical protein